MHKLIPISVGFLVLAGLLLTLPIDASGDLVDELSKIIDNAPYPREGKSLACLLYDTGGSGGISTFYCKDSSNRANMEYLIGLGKFCVYSIDIRDQDSGPAYWSYKLLYNKQAAGYLKTNELKSSLPVCP